MMTMSVHDQSCGPVVKGGVHIHITTHTMLRIFFQPTHPPPRTANVEHTEFIRNKNPLRMTFLILKDVTHLHGQENKKTLLLNVMIHSQSFMKLKTQQGRGNGKQVQTTMLNLAQEF